MSSSSMETIEKANEIIDEYLGDGYVLTLRQLYYQFVARGLLDNTQREYKRLGSVVNDGRLAGLIDWDAVEDRTRHVTRVNTWEAPHKIVETAAHAYREDLWASQENRVEVWIEKEALAGVFERVCKELRLPYLSCRGYVSQSEMWRSAMRFQEEENATIVLHFGDHDPSGIDMTRDIRDRLNDTFGAYVDVRRLALNMDQIERYRPPPNPTKLTDARSTSYVREYGNQSWELDALDPSVLTALVRDEVNEVLDMKAWRKAERHEEAGRKSLRAVVRSLSKTKKK